jgi:hypothetical protein
MSDRNDVDRLSGRELAEEFFKKAPQKYVDRINAAYERSTRVAPIVIGLGGLASLLCFGLTAVHPEAIAGPILVVALYVIYSTGTLISKYRIPSLRWAWLGAAAATAITLAAIAQVSDVSLLGASLVAAFLVTTWSVPAFFAVRSVAFLKRFGAIMEEATAERKSELLEQERERELAYLAWSQRKPDGSPSPNSPAAATLPLPKSK